MAIGIGSSWDQEEQEDKPIGGIHDNFQVIKPIQMKPNEQVVGRASSNVGQLEAEIERLKKRIQELEAEQPIKKKKKVWNNQILKDLDDEFFEQLASENNKRKASDERGKRNTKHNK